MEACGELLVGGHTLTFESVKQPTHGPLEYFFLVHGRMVTCALVVGVSDLLDAWTTWSLHQLRGGLGRSLIQRPGEQAPWQSPPPAPLCCHALSWPEGRRTRVCPTVRR